jgi:arginine repressor
MKYIYILNRKGDVIMKITNVRKDETGKIVAVKTDTGMSMTISEAISQAQQGSIEGVIVGTDRDGGLYLHSKRGQYDYKLSELPEF